MIVKTDKKWILARLFWILIACVGIATGQFLLGMVLIIITLQRTAHEFIHALTVIITKGTVNEIVLGPGHVQYIDFNATSRESSGWIYLSGFIFDILCTGGSAAMLMMYPNILWQILGFAMICMLVLLHMVPEECDFKIWMHSDILHSTK